MSTKPRYFFLFNDCLLITKRTGQAKFLLRLWMYLKAGVQLYSMPDSPNYEFRLLVPVQGTVKEAKKRRLIIYAKSLEQKEQWVHDLAHCLWSCTGKKGPDPSKDSKGKTVSVGLDADEQAEEEEEDRKRGIVKKPTKTKSTKDEEEEKRRKQKEMEAAAAAKKAKEKEEDDAKEYSSDEDEAALDESGGASLIDFDSISDTNPDARGLDSTGKAIPKGVQLGSVDQGAPAQGPSGGGVGIGGAYPWPPGTVIDPATGYPIYPGLMFPPGTPIDPATGLPLGYIFPPGYNPAVAGAASGIGAGGIGGTGAVGIDLGNPSDPNLSLLGVTKDVSAAIHDLVQSKKDSQKDKSDSVNLDDLAQKELLEATATIEAITKQLMARPRKAADKPPDAEITMDDVSDAILNATQAIAKAASALLKAATGAQAERTKAGHIRAQETNSPYNSDPVWSEGLISASQYVVATTQNLVTTADQAISGQAKEENLVASAKAVSAATAQLVSANRAKSVATSPTSQSLEEAAKGITKATAQLVQISAQFTSALMSEQKKPDTSIPTKYSLTEAQKLKLEKQVKILELEKQAEQARKDLEDMNKSGYKH